jgi:hypothetical protein
MAKTATARKTELAGIARLQELARAQRVALEAGKAGYSRADEIQAEIEKQLHARGELVAGHVIDMGNGKGLQVVDPFAKSGKAYKPAGIRRWELKEINLQAASVTSKL